MLDKKRLQLMGAFFPSTSSGHRLVDGVFLVSFGRAYVRRWQIGDATNPYRRAMDWLAERPTWLLRAAGVAEAGLGLALFRKAREEREDHAILDT